METGNAKAKESFYIMYKAEREPYPERCLVFAKEKVKNNELFFLQYYIQVENIIMWMKLSEKHLIEDFKQKK